MENDELLEFFKMLSNPERLKIVGLLSIEALTPPEIARRLKLQPMNVLRHLERLQGMGLVKSTQMGAGDMIENAPLMLDADGLQAMSRRVLSGSRPKFNTGEMEGEAFDLKVLRDYMTADGKLRSIPTQEKKLQAVLRYIVKVFEPEQAYTEKQVNEILSRYHADTAMLRRGLVDSKMMTRSEGIYRKV